MERGGGLPLQKRGVWGWKKPSHDEGVGGTTCLEVVLAQEF